MEIVYKKIDELHGYDKNARIHGNEQIQQIALSIQNFGFNDPIEIDDTNTILSGHGRLAAAIKLGLSEVPTITHGHMDDDQRKAYILAANRIAMNSTWDNALLKDEFSTLKDHDFDLSLTGFGDDEIFDILDDHEINEGLVDADECSDVEEKVISKLGDVWLMGKHRLVCGDSTSIDAVEKLMNNEKADCVFTDPPYNTGMTSQSQSGSGGLLKGNGKSNRLSNMFDDSYTDDEWHEFMDLFTTQYYMLMKNDSVAYICLDWRRNHQLIPYIDKAGFHRSNLIVWDKMVHGLGSDYKYCHEFINVCKKGKPVLHTNQGTEKEYYDIWHIQRKMGKDEDHATKKPIELVERSLNHSTKKNDLVVDLFGGSGSTLIACEKLGRRCYMMELEPKYIDVIIRRFEKFTGKKAILESTGETFNG